MILNFLRLIAQRSLSVKLILMSAFPLRLYALSLGFSLPQGAGKM